MTKLPSTTTSAHKFAKALLLLALIGLSCERSLAAGQQANASPLPEDVRAFIERRDGCDHFRGEDSPDVDRRAEIDRELRRLCTGTDAELARLKRIYSKNHAVQRSLDDYEVNIETGN